VWGKLEELATARIISAPVDVRIELAEQKDDLFAWAKDLDGFFVEADRALLGRSKEIINAHPRLINPNSSKSGADPFVIALAELNAVPVVTYETRAKATAAPKIPNVCESRGLKVMTLVDVLRAEGFAL
jgi:hypothetical protein